MANKHENFPSPNDQNNLEQQPVASPLNQKVKKWPTKTAMDIDLEVEKELTEGRERRKRLENQTYAREQTIEEPRESPTPSVTEIEAELSTGRNRRQKLEENTREKRTRSAALPPPPNPKYHQEIDLQTEKKLLINHLLAKNTQFDQKELEQINAGNLRETMTAELINQCDQNINTKIPLMKLEQVTGRLFPTNDPDATLKRYENFKREFAESLLTRLGILGPNYAGRSGNLNTEIIDELALLYRLDSSANDQMIIDIAKKDVFLPVEQKQRQEREKQRQIIEELVQGQERRRKNSRLSQRDDESFTKKSAIDELSQETLSTQQPTREYRRRIIADQEKNSLIGELLAQNTEFSPENLNLLNEQNIREELISRLINRCANNDDHIRIHLMKLEQLTGNLFPMNDNNSLRKRLENFRREFAESLLARIGILGHQYAIPNRLINPAVANNFRLIYNLSDSLNDREVVEITRKNVFLKPAADRREKQAQAHADRQIQTAEEVYDKSIAELRSTDNKPNIAADNVLDDINRWRQENTNADQENDTLRKNQLPDQKISDYTAKTETSEMLLDVDLTIKNLLKELQTATTDDPKNLPMIINHCSETINKGINVLSGQISDCDRKINSQKSVVIYMGNEKNKTKKRFELAKEYLRQIPFYKLYTKYKALAQLDHYRQLNKEAEKLYDQVVETTLKIIPRDEDKKKNLINARVQYQKLQEYFKRLPNMEKMIMNNAAKRQNIKKQNKSLAEIIDDPMIHDSRERLMKMAEDPEIKESTYKLINLIENIRVAAPEDFSLIK